MTHEIFLYYFVTYLLHFMDQLHSLIHIFFCHPYRHDIPMKFKYRAHSCSFILFYLYHLE